MPRKTKTPKKAKRTTKRSVKKPELTVAPVEDEADLSSASVSAVPSEKPSHNRVYVYGAVLLAVIVAAFFMVKNGMLVAAVVNGRPIFSWQLNQMMAKRYGQQTLEGMITEQLISDAAKKDGVTITPEDVTARENEMLKNIGGNVSLDDLLKYQGITKADFDSQIRMQLEVEKILGKDITVSDADISQYIASNSATMTATDEAGMKKEARQAIFEQQIGQKVQQWFTELKQKANITRFL